MDKMVDQDYLSLKDKLGENCRKAHLDNYDDFRIRFEYGLVAQKLFLENVLKAGIKPLKHDNLYFDKDLKVPKPKPDFEFERCFIEIRRQDFYDNVLLGYKKKYDGWREHSVNANKTLYFCMLSKSMNHIAFTNLTENEGLIFELKNSVGDIDYCIPLYTFRLNYFREGMEEIIKILSDNKLKEWM